MHQEKESHCSNNGNGHLPVAQASKEEPTQTSTSIPPHVQSSDLGTACHGKCDDKSMPIAIIGMSCRFPGDACNPEKLWEMCSQGRSAWSEVPPTKFNAGAFYHPNKERNGSIIAQGGYFLKQDTSHFDAKFFSINAEEAKAMDPQLRILLECAYEALENAGLPMKVLSGSNTSVFAASFNHDYDEILNQDVENTPLYNSTGTSQASIANRISYFFNLKGPSVAIDTACSGSLVALHLACQNLRSSESKQAIVGGVNIILNPNMMIKMTSMGFFSPDGKCYAFDDRATGYARGEGAATIILKPLSDAIRDGDSIRAVIRESNVNQDGRTAGITLPSQEAQENLIKSAYLRAGLDPLETGYVEAHGTGTQAGDPIEAAAIASVFGPRRTADQPLFIGSIKTNVGHLEGASGLAGIIKAVMILEKGFIPPSLNFKKANPRIPLEKLKLKIPLDLEPWPSNRACRVSVNSFGFGGTNAHVIIEDSKHYQSKDLNGTHQTGPSSASGVSNLLSVESENQRRVFVLSANDKETCEVLVKNLVEYIQKHAETKGSLLGDLAYTLDQRRSKLPWKLAVCATLPTNLIKALQGGPKPKKSSITPRLGFVFTGQGAQWYAMGRELIDAYPVFKSSLEMADKYLKSLGATWSIFIELNRDLHTTRVNAASISQPLSTAIQIALVDLLASWGIKPIAVVGHSSGEAAAAYAANALSMKSALSVTYFKGLLTMSLKDKAPHLKGAMLAVGLSQEDTETHIATITTGHIVVACVNSPMSVTVSGDVSAIDELYTKLESKNIFARKLKIDTAYHSFHMQTIANDYLQALGELEPRSPSFIEIWSSVTGHLVQHGELDASYWVKHMVSPVQFSEALRNLCFGAAKVDEQHSDPRKATIDILVEIGPHSALSGPVKQILATLKLEEAQICYAPSLVRNTDAVLAAQKLACTLFTNGYPVDLDTINSPKGHDSKQIIADLPPYPWSHIVSHWHESRLSSNHRFRKYPRHDLLGAPVIDFNELEPKWRNIIRVSDMPWVKEHIVQASIVYPGAGLIVMALEAIRQSKALQNENITGYRLRNVSFGKALVIPDTPEGIETSFALRPFAENSFNSSSTWQEFRIFSHSEQDGWSEHCRGLISAEQSHYTEVDGGREAQWGESEIQLKFSNAELVCKETITAQKMYEMLGSFGYNFGKTFQTMVSLRAGSSQALCTFSIPDTASIMPHKFEYPHLVHPVTLDAVLQAIFPALASQDTRIFEPLLPSFIGELYIAQNINNSYGHRFNTHISASRSRSRETEAAIVVVDPSLSDYAPVVEIKDFKCTFLGTRNDAEQDEEMKRLCFKLCWELDVDLINCETAERVLGAPLDPLASAKIPMFEQASLYYIEDALENLTDLDYESMEPHHQLFFDWLKLQSKSAKEGLLDYVNPQVLSATPAERQSVWRKVGSHNIEGQLLCRVGENLTRILRREVQPLTLMLENDLLHKFYTEVINEDYCTAQLISYIDKLAFKRPSMKVLEIGAGTGGGTLPVLQTLGGFSGKNARFSHYDFTDISSGFFEKAQLKFRDWNGLVNFRTLDIERDPETQGFQKSSYDLIIAIDVLHATRNMDTTMRNVRKLLKPSGKLILLEITRHRLRISTIFGTLPGWWLGAEETRKLGPILSESQWANLLEKHSFSGIDICLKDFPAEQDHMHSLIFSTAIGEVPQYPPVTLIHDGTKTGVSIDTLKSSLSATTGVDPVVTTLENAQVDGTVCIFLYELHEPVLSNPHPALFKSIKELLLTAAGVLWVSRGGSVRCDKPDVSLIAGLLRTLRSERKTWKLATLDLDAQNCLSDDATAKMVLDTFRSVFNLTKEENRRDVEFAEKGGSILIPRIIENISMNGSVMKCDRLLKSEIQPLYQPGRYLGLEIEKPGLLDTLKFVDIPAMSLPLADDDVEIETRATGLNFRDIMLSMGQMSAKSFNLGQECSGIITRVGKKVIDLSAGDRVCGWVKVPFTAFSNTLRTPRSFVERILDDMTYEVAASIPIAYVTASVSLYDTARLQKGETVLIHAATGGVGQAAIAFARLIGAEIFATVGSVAKKEFLMRHYNIPDNHIFSSRDTSFAQGIMRMTNNNGVDVILNSLAGDGLQKSWQCMAEFGRFVEIGKRDIIINSRLDMAPFDRNVTFSSVDLTLLIQQKGNYASKVLANIIEMFRAKILEPMPVITSYSYSEIETAFRLMQSGKHIGKLVLVPKREDQIKAIPIPSQLHFQFDASYLLVGGLGGLGRSIARWMMHCGAKNIIFLSRSGLITDNSKNIVKELEEGGVRVATYTCDVGEETQLAEALQDIVTAMPPIRGVIQSALVLKDTPFENMSFEQYQKVIFPKVHGSWNLHKQFSQMELDFFVMLSSAMGIVGNGGQANYGAASSFQDALAYYRSSQGLPAIALDVGIILDAGYVSEHEGLKEKLERQGLKGMLVKEFLTILECAITQPVKNRACQIITGLQTQEIMNMPGSSDVDALFWIQDPRFSHLLSKSAIRRVESSDVAIKFDRTLRNAKTFTEALQIACEAITEKLSHYLLIPKEDINLTQTTASYGVDSLIAVELRNWIQRELKADIPTFEILRNITLLELSRKVTRASKLIKLALVEDQDTKKIPDPVEGLGHTAETARLQKMSALVEKYSKSLPSQSCWYSPGDDDKWTVILTGSTGSLGSYLLESLLINPKVAKIICLNRSANAADKYVEVNSTRGLSSNLPVGLVEFYQINLGERKLGLGADKYESLRLSATHIIHNAWKLDLNSSIEFFEREHINGVRQLIDLSLASTKNARIIFLSSVASVMRWPNHYTGNAPEGLINDFRVASDMGYGEAKHVAERLLGLANTKTGIRVSILRIGQVTGPVQKPGMWSKSEWFPGLIASSKFLGLLPNSLSIADADTVNWIPVDVLSTVIVEILEAAEIKRSSDLEVFNIVNPHMTNWKTLIPTIKAYISRNQGDIRLVPFEDWLDAVQERGMTESKAVNPAMEMADFYLKGLKTGFGSVSKVETGKAVTASQSLRALEEIKPEWMEMWLKQWDC